MLKTIGSLVFLGSLLFVNPCFADTKQEIKELHEELSTHKRLLTEAQRNIKSLDRELNAHKRGFAKAQQNIENLHERLNRDEDNLSIHKESIERELRRMSARLAKLVAMVDKLEDK